MRLFLPAVACAIFAGPAAAADPPPARPVDPPSAEELAAIMKTLLTSALPDPLVEQSSNWGHQSEVANGVTWETGGIVPKPHKQKKLKNNGTWRRIKVEAVDPDKNLTLAVRNVQQPEKGRLTFDMVVALQTRINFEQQVWKSGTRLYSGSTRARCLPILFLKCESTSRAVKTDGILPDVVFRLRVLDAKLTYDQFKVEHTAGVGGDAAEVLGGAVHDMIKQLKPSLEKDLLEKANRAIVKAGDTKEVKLGLGRLFDGK
jgi:hypothetical protein